MTVWYPYYCKILVNMTELKPGTVVRIVKADNSTYQAIYCGQKDQYFIVGSKNEDFCIKSFTDTVTDFNPCGCSSFRFVKPKYVYIEN